MLLWSARIESEPPLPGPMSAIQRLAFASRFRTLRKLAVDGEGRLWACGRSGIHAVPRRCPHQGADLLNADVQGDDVVCHWHGCRFRLGDETWSDARIGQ